MGVDFYTCENCERTFPDCGPYFSCTGCYSRFCSDKCGVKQIVQEEGEEDDGNYLEEVTSCIFCRKESVTDHDMVHFLLKKAGLTYDQAVQIFREEPEE